MIDTQALSRRGILLGGSAFGALLALGIPAFGQGKGSFKFTGKLPPVLFRPTENGTGMLGPWGEVRTVKAGGGLLPYFLQSADKGGVFDFSGSTFFIRLGDASNGLTITSDGFAIGKGKPIPWKGNVQKLAGLIKGNKAWTRSAMQMRSAFISSFAVAATQQKAMPSKDIGLPFLQAIKDVAEAGKCTTRTITESVTRTIEQTVDVVKSAETAYRECYDRAIASGGCKGLFFAPLIIACAITYCGAKTFIDTVVGVTTILIDVVDEVTREVIDCVKPIAGYLPNDWSLQDLPLPRFEEPAFIRELREGIMQAADVAAALRLLRDNLDGVLSFLGPFACLFEGDWNIATLPPIAGVGVPFGVELCITAACARGLTAGNLAGAAATAWAGALSLLATFNAGAAAAMASIGITPIAELAAAVAGLGTTATAAGAVIACLVILVLYHATLISAQISVLLAVNPGVLNDGKLCLVHPTLAAAAVAALTVGTLSPVQLVPPIVVG